jgi:hexosaminidase
MSRLVVDELNERVYLKEMMEAELQCRVESPAHVPLWPLPKDISAGNEVAYVDAGFRFEIVGAERPTILRRVVEQKQATFDSLRAQMSSHPKTCAPFPPGTTNIKTLQIRVQTSEAMMGPDMSEVYTLEVDTSETAKLNAKTVHGAIRGLATWSQLVREACGWWHVAHLPLRIQDEPRFAHRGLLLDTSRHFFPIKDILRTLDGMEAAKMNVFHWHIVDSNAFPMESKAYPNLQQYGAAGENKKYSFEDVNKVVEYGALKGIRIIPEFDMPGHSYAWGLGTPELVVCPNMEDWKKYAAQVRSRPSLTLSPTHQHACLATLWSA